MPGSDAKRFRALAVEALSMAAEMSDPDCRRMMTALAASYERLADYAEGRETGGTPPDRRDEQ
jgi:hypothetical protein